MSKLTVFCAILLVTAVLLLSRSQAQARGHSPPWKTYQNRSAGFAVHYPPGWTVHEHHGSDKSLLVRFISPHGATIGVTARITLPDDVDRFSVLNAHCRSMKAGRLTAIRCLDTLHLVIQTIVITRMKTYIIDMAGKGGDKGVYERVVKGFELLRRSALA